MTDFSLIFRIISRYRANNTTGYYSKADVIVLLFRVDRYRLLDAAPLQAGAELSGIRDQTLGIDHKMEVLSF